MTVSVVIPAFNEEKSISATLESLAKQQTDLSFEVIVVDNASTDRTAEVANSFADRLSIRVISESRKGRGQARTTGFAAAQGEIIFSTDADTWLPSDWLQVMTEPFVDSSVVAVTSVPKITDAGPLTNWVYNNFGATYFYFHQLMSNSHPLVGFSFAVRREAYNASGGFNPQLLSEEDVDLGLRVGKVGKIVLVRSTNVITSGRRWKRGLLWGGLQYALTTLGRLLGRPRDLSDVR